MTWSGVLLALVGLVGSIAIALLLGMGHGRLATFAMLLAALVGSAVVQPRFAIFLTVLYLAVLGDARRLLLALFGFSEADPLVLIGPAVTVALILVIISNQLIRVNSRLSTAIAALSGLMILQMLNPKQGALAVGIIGALFYLVPLLWFWIGKVYATERFVKQVLLWGVLPVAVLASFVGLYQTFVGLLPHQEIWVKVAGYTALYVDDHVRAFGFFPSSEEYVYYLGVGATIACAFVFQKSWVHLALVVLLIGTAFLGGTRTIIVLFLFAAVIMWAVQGRTIKTWVPRLVFAVVIGLVGLFWSLQQVSSSDATGQAASMMARQAELLDPSQTTAGGHVGLIANGIYRGFATPIGHGLGATTHAAGRYGIKIGGSEKDFSDMFIALGFIGGLLYLAVMGLAFWNAAMYWHLTRKTLGLVMLGIIVVMLGQWLKGGLYAINPLIWFVIGATDGMLARHKEHVAERMAERTATAQHVSPEHADSRKRAPHSHPA